MHPAVSIVIPVKGRNDNLDECVRHCQSLDYPDFEIIAVPDYPLEYPGVKVLPSGPVGPADKRELALGEARGDILAFLDDDAYPGTEWLKNAVRYFADDRVAAVGGPAVTPESDSLLQQASGLVYSSILASGNVTYRYLPGTKREVDDYPSCNLLVRRSILEEVGGFDTTFWPGEDTKLCLQITRDLHKKIIYAPDALVYHHRRPLFRPHLRQISNYALHRGYFMKRFPETSLRLTYFLPTVFTFALITGGILAVLNPTWRRFYLTGLAIYLILLLLSSLKAKRPLAVAAVAGGIFATHVFYGIGLVRGLMAAKLKEESAAKASVNESNDFISTA